MDTIDKIDKMRRHCIMANSHTRRRTRNPCVGMLLSSENGHSSHLGMKICPYLCGV